MLVKEMLEEMKLKWLSVAYGHPRLIKIAGEREVIVGLFSWNSGIVVFPKRGGYGAYQLNKSHLGNHSARIGFNHALNEIIRAEQKGLGKAYWQSEKTKKEIMDKIVLDEI